MINCCKPNSFKLKERTGFYQKLLTAKETKRLSKIADEVLSLEEDMAILTDEEIKIRRSNFNKYKKLKM